MSIFNQTFTFKHHVTALATMGATWAAFVLLNILVYAAVTMNPLTNARAVKEEGAISLFLKLILERRMGTSRIGASSG